MASPLSAQPTGADQLAMASKSRSEPWWLISTKQPDFLQFGDLTMVLLERADRHLIRVWDKNSKLRKKFTGFNQYPVNPEYRIEAKYTEYDTPKTRQV